MNVRNTVASVASLAVGFVAVTTIAIAQRPTCPLTYGYVCGSSGCAKASELASCKDKDPKAPDVFYQYSYVTGNGGGYRNCGQGNANGCNAVTKKCGTQDYYQGIDATKQPPKCTNPTNCKTTDVESTDCENK